MLKSLFILLSLIAGSVLHAQYPGYKLVADQTTFKTSFEAASKKITSVKSDFVQEKSLSMLSEKITSKGKFYFRKEDALRMEYTSPFQYLMIINGSKIYIKDSQKENKFSSKSNKLFQSVNRLMMDCAKGTVFNNADFTVKLYEGNDDYLAELTPVTKDMKGFFKKINLYIRKKTNVVSKVEMHEPSGDKTTITYSNQELNTKLVDDLFAIK